MQLATIGHTLDILRDGATAISHGSALPFPLAGTFLDIHVRHGFATVELIRTFENREDRPIEVVLTFPVPFEAALAGLEAKIDGRRLKAVAQGKTAARETYEDAISTGKAAILHEEPLRGIHVLSVGNVGAGQKVTVTSRFFMPVGLSGETPFLRIPMTAGQLYGQSPFEAVDDLLTDPSLQLSGKARVTLEGEGRALNSAGQPFGGDWFDIDLGSALEVLLPGMRFGELRGIAADGRALRLSATLPDRTNSSLDIAVLVDRSGSTSSAFERTTVWQAMKDALEHATANFHEDDRIALWQFDGACQKLGDARGPSFKDCLRKLEGPAGGTELAGAVRAVTADGRRPILILTDGQTYSNVVQPAALQGAPIFIILVGEGSLSAGAGHLAAITGGQVFNAARGRVGEAVASALAAMRRPSQGVRLVCDGADPIALETIRGGVRLKVQWDLTPSAMAACDSCGAYAASLALSALSETHAEALAVAHGLASHLTSLVIVDEDGPSQDGLPKMRKLALPEADSLGASNLCRSLSTQSASITHACKSDATTAYAFCDNRGPFEKAIAKLALARLLDRTEEPMAWEALRKIVPESLLWELESVSDETGVPIIDIFVLGYLSNIPRIGKRTEEMYQSLRKTIPQGWIRCINLSVRSVLRAERETMQP